MVPLTSDARIDSGVLSLSVARSGALVCGESWHAAQYFV
jgi:hypothetical protein